MIKQRKSVRGNTFIKARALDLQLTIFDQQDGKLVDGMIIDTTDTWFALQCTDGQIRRFDIGALPPYRDQERFLLSADEVSRKVYRGDKNISFRINK